MSAAPTNLAYVRHAIFTAFRVARFERDVIRNYDLSFEGFFRSFYAILLCAPFYAVVVLSEQKIAVETTASTPGADLAAAAHGGFNFFLTETGAYLLGWLALPVVMIGLVRLIGASARYVPFVVAYNWGTCIVLAATLPPHLLYLMNLLSLTGVGLLYYPITIFTLVYRWRVAREGLAVSGITAAAIVIIDVLIGVFVAVGAAKLEGGM